MNRLSVMKNKLIKNNDKKRLVIDTKAVPHSSFLIELVQPETPNRNKN